MDVYPIAVCMSWPFLISPTWNMHPMAGAGTAILLHVEKAKITEMLTPSSHSG